MLAIPESPLDSWKSLPLWKLNILHDLFIANAESQNSVNTNRSTERTIEFGFLSVLNFMKSQRVLDLMSGI